jgi:hypothetical protein
MHLFWGPNQRFRLLMVPATIFILRRSTPKLRGWSRRQLRALETNAGDDLMAVIHDLVEDWIQIRSTLQRQLKMLQSGETPSESDISENEKTATVARIKGCIEEMNALLKEYARVHQL